ncbi:hypothetical protein AS25_08365 [Kocuria marina]|uniref:Uncharacterized protein n=1 Tax=Kocuria marina TaxID=223184 RepID=A0A0B0D856_9MICC|nr:hypothetical protein [Kocuria marina]KHE74176.1 hypothetical protein AS25_08365 [Kocuria marina]
MGFEVFDQRRTPMKGAPSVTIQKSGLISINSAAHALIDAPEVIEILFDPDRQVIAFRAAEISPRSYRLRVSSSSRQAQVAAVSFLGHYRIGHSTSRRYEPFVEEGMLCIDLQGPSTQVHGNRTKTVRPAVEEDREH